MPFQESGSSLARGGEDYFGYWFSGHVYDPQFYISRKEADENIPIEFMTDYAFNDGDAVSATIDSTTNYLYFNFTSTYKFGLGYIKPVEFTFKLGIDVI